ncbi:MAG: signal recognition particle-docking protein FtsY, partial [Persicimonas sp.]
DMPIHQGEEEADPSSVLYAGIERGIEKGKDVVICDTSGRLQTNVNLMDELAKMARVAGKAKEGAPHETMLVLDANTGQNAIAQAKKFNDAVEITGIALTKLDGTARGGVILGICNQLEAPVRYIGIGESVADLRPFDAEEFVEALFM